MDHGPEPDTCTVTACAEIRAAQSAELIRMRDDAYRRRQNEAEDRRRAKAVLRRTFEEDRALRGDLFVQSWVTRAVAPLRNLIHRVETLPARPKAGDLEQLRDVATGAEHTIRAYTEGLDVGSFYADSRAELLRIRRYVVERGQALHAVHGNAHADNQLGCRCAGCELIIGLDDVELPSLAEGVSA